jgi:hypothetical protein
MSATLVIREYGLAQREQPDEQCRTREDELWRVIGGLQSARSYQATQIAAIDEELHDVERRMAERIEDVEEHMRSKIDAIVDTIRSNVRTAIAIGAVLVALAQLVVPWLH